MVPQRPQQQQEPKSFWRRQVEQSLFEQFYPSVVATKTLEYQTNNRNTLVIETTQNQSLPTVDIDIRSSERQQQQSDPEPQKQQSDPEQQLSDMDREPEQQQQQSDTDREERIPQRNAHLAVTFLDKKTKHNQKDIDTLVTLLASLRKVPINDNPPIRHVESRPHHQPKIIKTRKIPRRTILSNLQDNYDLDDDEFDLLLMDLQFPSMLDEEYSADEFETEVPSQNRVNQIFFSKEEENDNNNNNYYDDNYGDDDTLSENEDEINAFLVASSAPESWYTPTSEDMEYDEFDSFETSFFDDDTIPRVGKIKETYVDANTTLEGNSIVTFPILNWKIHHSEMLPPTIRPLPPPLQDDDDGSYNELEIRMLGETEFPLDIEMDWLDEEEDDLNEHDYKVLQDSVITPIARLKEREPELFLDNDVIYNDDECTDVETDITVGVIPVAEILDDDTKVILSDDLQSLQIPHVAVWPVSLFAKSNGYSQPVAMTRPPPPNNILPRSDHPLRSSSNSVIQPHPPILPPPPPLHGRQEIPARLVVMNHPPHKVLPPPPPPPTLPRRTLFPSLPVGIMPPPTVRPPPPLNRYQQPKRQITTIAPPPPGISLEQLRDTKEQFSR